MDMELFTSSSTNKLGASACRWADDGISAVRYNLAGTLVDRVVAHPDYGDAIGTPSEYTRQNIIASMKAGIAFVTILKSGEAGWMKGSPIGLYTINGMQYLKTADDREEADKLGELPAY